MAVRITGRRLEVSNDVRAYIEDKMPRITKYTDRIQSLEFVLEKDGYQFKAEMRLKAGPIDVLAKAKDAVLLRAVDTLIDKVEAQLRKKWEKLRGKKKTRSSSKANWDVEEKEIAMASGNGSRPKPKGTGKNLPLFVEKIGVRVFPSVGHDAEKMAVEQAAEELFFKDENFLCFMNEKSRKLNVIYRRKDGHFAIIEPAGE